MVVKKRNYAQRIGLIPMTSKQLIDEGRQKSSEANAALQQKPVTTPNSNLKNVADVPKPKGTGQIDTFTNVKTGETGGIRLPDGRIFLGLNPSEVRKVAQQEQAKVIQGTQKATGGQLSQQEQIQQGALLADQVSQMPNVTEADILRTVPQEPGLENLQAGASAFGGAVAGAGTGAAIGTAALPGIGTAIGAVAGGLIGAIGGAYAKITADKRGDVKQAYTVAKLANTNFGQTIDALNAGLISKDEALRRFNEDKVNLYAAQTNLKRDTDTNLDRFISGGADELAKVDDMTRDLQNIYAVEFQLALVAPNPQNIKYINNNLDLENG